MKNEKKKHEMKLLLGTLLFYIFPVEKGRNNRKKSGEFLSFADR